jgi:oxalate decarboxylase/phosphoglucose isomerase-like protein (cupin superfamily)
VTTQLTPINVVNTYQKFQQEEGIPIVTGFFVEDLEDVDVKPWARLGGLGSYINLDGCGGVVDCYIAEIPPGGKLNPKQHMFEELMYVVSGRGATQVGESPSTGVTFEWGPGSVFSVPLNMWHQHFNGSGDEPARLMAVTNAPLIMNLFHNQDFVFKNDFTFSDRAPGANRFQGEGTKWRGDAGAGFVWETNFIPNAISFSLDDVAGRGAGGTNAMLELAHNTLTAHISEFPVGRYKKAHRHGPGAHVIVLTGTGFSLLWPRWGEPGSTRVDWKPGSVVVPPTEWFHQHFNGGNTPARYLALRWGSRRYPMSLGDSGDDSSISQKDGGGQIEYPDEDPCIHEMFEEAIGQQGAECRMRSFISQCNGTVD